MRLEGIKSIAEGNKFLESYLPVFNKRFCVEPAIDEDLHRPLVAGVGLEKIFTIRTERALRNDFTVVHKGKLYQVEDSIRSDKVIIERPVKIRQPHKIRKAYTPAWEHPWRNRVFQGDHMVRNKEEALAGVL